MDRWFAIPDYWSGLNGATPGICSTAQQDTPVGVPCVEPYLTTTAGEVSLPRYPPLTYHGHDWRLYGVTYVRT